MSPIEFDLLDELYFVTSFSELEKNLTFTAPEIEMGLKELIRKGFVKCLFPDPDTEITPDTPGFEAVFQNCFFLATKTGLLAHNSR